MDVPVELRELSGTLSTIEAVIDVPTLQAEADDLEQRASAPDLWNDTENAQKVTSRLSFVQGEIRRVTDLRRRVDEPARALRHRRWRALNSRHGR